MKKQDMQEMMKDLDFIVRKINDLFRCDIQTGWRIEADCNSPDSWAGGNEEQLNLSELADVCNQYTNAGAVYGIDEWSIPLDLGDVVATAIEKQPILHGLGLNFIDFFEYYKGYSVWDERPDDPDWSNAVRALGVSREDPEHLIIETAIAGYLGEKIFTISDLRQWRLDDYYFQHNDVYFHGDYILPIGAYNGCTINVVISTDIDADYLQKAADSAVVNINNMYLDLR